MRLILVDAKNGEIQNWIIDREALKDYGPRDPDKGQAENDAYVVSLLVEDCIPVKLSPGCTLGATPTKES